MTIRAFLVSLPVRQKDVSSTSLKQIAAVKNQIQAYALARPGVHEGRQSTIADAARNAFGIPLATECELCHWSSTLGYVEFEEPDLHMVDSKHYAISAFLPKLGFDASNINGYGQYLSVDFRPVAAGKGTMKKIVTIYKRYLQQCTAQDIKNPFACINIMCPVGSYDPNIEPAKDDMLFSAEDEILAAVDTFFSSIYAGGQPRDRRLAVGVSAATRDQQELEQAKNHLDQLSGFPSQISNTTAAQSQFSDSEPINNDALKIADVNQNVRSRELSIPIRLASRTPSIVIDNTEAPAGISFHDVTEAFRDSPGIGFDTQDLKEIAAGEEAFLRDPRPKDVFEAAKTTALLEIPLNPLRLAPRPVTSIFDVDQSENGVQCRNRAAVAASKSVAAKPVYQPRSFDQSWSTKSNFPERSTLKPSSSCRQNKAGNGNAREGPMDAYLRRRAPAIPMDIDELPTDMSSSIAGTPYDTIPEAPTRKRRAPVIDASEDDLPNPRQSKHLRMDDYMDPLFSSPMYMATKPQTRVTLPPKFSSSPAISRRDEFSSPIKSGLPTPDTSPLKQPFSPPFMASKITTRPLQDSHQQQAAAFTSTTAPCQAQPKLRAAITKLPTTIPEVKREYIDLTLDSDDEGDDYTSGRNQRSAFDVTGLTATQAGEVVDSWRQRIETLLGVSSLNGRLVDDREETADGSR